MELTNHGRGTLELRNDRLLEGITDAEAQEAQKHMARLLGDFGGQKVLGAAARREGDDLVLNVLGIKGLIAQLAAPDTLTVDTLLLGSVLDQLRQVGLDTLARVAKTVLRGLLKVTLDAVDANPLGRDALTVNQHILEFGGIRCALRIGLPLAAGLPLLNLGEVHVQTRVILHIVWDEVRVRLKHLLIAFLVTLWCSTRKVGHDVNLHLEPIILQQLDGCATVAREVAAVDLAQEVVICVLDANLHARDAITTKANNLCGGNLVRARLHAEADHVDARRHIQRLLLLDSAPGTVTVLVEGVGAIIQVADESVGDGVIIATEGAAEDAELHLVNLVAIGLKRLEPNVDLLDGVKADLERALEDVLIAEIRARHSWLIRAKVAIVLTTELVRWQRDAHIQDAARAADGLLNERIAQRRNHRELCGLGLVEILVQESQLPLGRNHLILATQVREDDLERAGRRKGGRRTHEEIRKDTLHALVVLGEGVLLDGNILNVHLMRL